RTAPRVHAAEKRSRRSPFALQLDHLGHDTPEIRSPLHRPRIGELTHRRGGCDRVDGDDFGETVGDEGGRLVAVDHDVLRNFAHQPNLWGRTATVPGPK